MSRASRRIVYGYCCSGATGKLVGVIARTAAIGQPEDELRDDMRYLVATWNDIRQHGDRKKAPSLLHRDLDLVQRILRDQLSDDFTAIRVDSEMEYARIVDFVHRVQPRLVRRVKLHTRDESIFETYTRGHQSEQLPEIITFAGFGKLNARLALAVERT